MFKNILFISDNPVICKRVVAIIRDSKYSHFKFNFGISPFSNRDDFEIDFFSINIYDLREEKVIDNIISKYDLIISLHCKQIFPKKLVNTIKCINVHPGYNPINRGWYPQVFSIINDLPIGATIHEIDNELDNGDIIDRTFVQKTLIDTSLSLYNKILDAEIELMKKNLENILNNNYTTIVPENTGNLYLKRDFNELRELNLDEETTMRKTINLLRALTHGEYKNAYFIDPEDGKKVFVSINLEK
ncbi:dTDP-4-amino-4,6-dideoxyglucose formyltransferase [Aequorivita echinoideorum]|uniref:dTDP-4-amino-4,6-dideoxyglucose formyltransferase n=1 Tax=Aequorivita echinoideorum TaxID=1549647 RepID=A0ABS5S3Z9_9FLAO|nr:dTDP-4-amino-4,6-dideoxyglucose formyltransferase [Aequorivita echinoideorum]MBT0607936.1 dTDP-4-amino-4,6-dideoxyglucose formyltransferase [Aequorivita echinoideorum]